MNSLSIVGRIGKVGELRYTPGGKAVINFSVATDNGKDADGEKRKPTWFEIALWEKQADGIAEYLAVGNRIGVTGQVRLQIDESKGTSYPKLVIDFARVELMSDNKGEQNGSARSAGRTAAPAGRRGATQIGEDVPF